MSDEETPPTPPKPKKNVLKKEREKMDEVISPIPQPKPLPKIDKVTVRDSVKDYPSRPSRPEKKPLSSSVVPQPRLDVVVPDDESKESSEKKTKKWVFFWWGLLFFTIWNVSLMFILEALLNPRDSMLATVVAYSIGIFGLIIYAALVRNKGQVLLAIPIMIIVLFGTSYLFHFLKWPIYNHFAPISERISLVLNAIESGVSEFGQNGNSIGNITFDQIEKYSQLAFLIDLLLCLPLFIFGTLSFVWFVQIFTSKPKLLTILSVLGALLFLFIGLLISPLLHLTFTGLLDFGLDIAPSIPYASSSATTLMNFENATQNDINAVIANLSIVSDSLSDSLENLPYFLFTLNITPYFNRISDDLLLLMSAAHILFEGIGPFVNGSYQIYRGFIEVSEALNYNTSTQSQNLAIKKQMINNTLFNQAMERINLGLDSFGGSIDLLNETYSKLEEISFEDITGVLSKLPGNTSNTLDFVTDVETYVTLFENATEVLTALLEKPLYNGSQTNYSTLSHFLYGYYNLASASDKIGETSSFNESETILNLESAQSNFSLVVSQMNKPIIQSVITSETLFLNDTCSFLYDMSSLTHSLTVLGLNTSTVFSNLADLLIEFDVGYENISDYSLYLEQANASVFATNELVVEATTIENNISYIQAKSNSSGYGIFSQPASEISTIFNDLNISRDIINSNFVANSLYYLLLSMKSLRETHQGLNNGLTAFTSGLFLEASSNFTAARTELELSISNLNTSISYMTNAYDGGMTQLAGSLNSMIIIRNSLISIRTDLDDTISIADSGDLGRLSELENKVNSIMMVLNSVNVELQNIAVQ